MRAKITERRGEFTVNGALMMLLVVFLMVLTVSVIGVANQGARLHSAASELARYIELRGRIDGAVYTELQRLEAVSGLSAALELDADYIPGTTKIQFGNTFRVTLSCDGHIGLGGILSLSIPLRGTVSGRSERYWLS
jgi:hypothetical protein